MAASEQRARELAQIEPPQSLQRIVRFLDDFARQLPLLQSAAAPSIGSQRKNPLLASGAWGEASEAFGLESLLPRYQIGIAEIGEFSLWLMRWNERRTATEVLTLAEFNQLNMPLAFYGQGDVESEDSSFFATHKERKPGVFSPVSHSVSAPQEQHLIGMEQPPERLHPEKRPIFVPASLPLAEVAPRLTDSPVHVRGANSPASKSVPTSLAREQGDDRSRSLGAIPVATDLARERNKSMFASPDASADGAMAFVPRREHPDTLRRAWRAAREEESVAEAPHKVGRVRHLESSHFLDVEPNPMAQHGLDPTTRKLAPDPALTILQRAVWGANLALYSSMAGFGAAQGSGIALGATAMAMASGAIGSGAIGSGAVGMAARGAAPMGIVPASLQGAVPVLNGGAALPLSRPALPTVSLLGVAPPQPDLATPSFPNVLVRSTSSSPPFIGMETRPLWAETGLPAPAPPPPAWRIPARSVMERVMERRQPGQTPRLPLPAPTSGQNLPQQLVADDALEPERHWPFNLERQRANSQFPVASPLLPLWREEDESAPSANAERRAESVLPDARLGSSATGRVGTGVGADQFGESPSRFGLDNPIVAPGEAFGAVQNASLPLSGLWAASAALWLQNRLNPSQDARTTSQSARHSPALETPFTQAGHRASEEIGEFPSILQGSEPERQPREKPIPVGFQPMLLNQPFLHSVSSETIPFGFQPALQGLKSQSESVANLNARRGEVAARDGKAASFLPRVWNLDGAAMPLPVPNEDESRSDFDGTPEKDRIENATPRFAPQFGALTIVAPPLRVASAQAEAGGAAVAFDWTQLAANAGTLDASGLARLRAVLPAGAQAIYPALTPGSEGPSGFTLRLAPPLLNQLLEKGYGVPSAVWAEGLANGGQRATSHSPSATALQARLVPTQRPMGRTASVLPAAPDKKGASGALAEAGTGTAQRGGVLDFLGLPVRLAPSLGGQSELSDQVAVRGGASGAAPATRPDAFAPLRERLFGRVAGITAEPDKAAWQQAAPDFGLRDARPTTLLAPDSRLKPPSAAQPGAQIEGSRAPETSHSGALFSPGAAPANNSFWPRSASSLSSAAFSPNSGFPATPALSFASNPRFGAASFATPNIGSQIFSGLGSPISETFSGAGANGISAGAARMSDAESMVPNLNSSLSGFGPFQPGFSALGTMAKRVTSPAPVSSGLSPTFAPRSPSFAGSLSPAPVSSFAPRSPSFAASLSPAPVSSRGFSPNFGTGSRTLAADSWSGTQTPPSRFSSPEGYLPSAAPAFSAPQLPVLSLGSVPRPSATPTTFSAFPSGGPSSAATGMTGASRLVSAPPHSGVAERAPVMLFSNPAGILDRRNPVAIQRSARGSTPTSAGAANEKSPSAPNAPANAQKGTSAQEVDLLAQEVWSLLKRRLDVEKQRQNFGSRAA